jgi:hypothetical protein
MCVNSILFSLHSGHFFPPVSSILISVSKLHSTSLPSCATDCIGFCSERCLLMDVVIAYWHILRLRNKIATWGRLSVYDGLWSRVGKNGGPSHSNRIESNLPALIVVHHLARVYCMLHLHSTGVSAKRISSTLINSWTWIRLGCA